jgi:hypothetical protein
MDGGTKCETKKKAEYHRHPSRDTRLLLYSPGLKREDALRKEFSSLCDKEKMNER